MNPRPRPAAATYRSFLAYVTHAGERLGLPGPDNVAVKLSASTVSRLAELSARHTPPASVRTSDRVGPDDIVEYATWLAGELARDAHTEPSTPGTGNGGQRDELLALAAALPGHARDYAEVLDIPDAPTAAPGGSAATSLPGAGGAETYPHPTAEGVTGSAAGATAGPRVTSTPGDAGASSSAGVAEGDVGGATEASPGEEKVRQAAWVSALMGAVFLLAVCGIVSGAWRVLELMST